MKTQYKSKREGVKDLYRLHGLNLHSIQDMKEMIKEDYGITVSDWTIGQARAELLCEQEEDKMSKQADQLRELIGIDALTRLMESIHETPLDQPNPLLTYIMTR